MKKRVTGIGGLFFKTKDPNASKEWYKKHLGFNTDDYGCTFFGGKIKREKIAPHNGVRLKQIQVTLNPQKNHICLITELKI